jgi:predicted AAA+ superfamily ATPase
MRYLNPFIQADLKQKMVFLGGPRQVGKTTLAVSLLPDCSEEDPGYLSWDHPKQRALLMKGELPSQSPLIVLDEVHKFARWRNLVKGLYDVHKSKRRFLVTGSARLDYYRKGGDSLLGRYHYYRLHPFSLRELDPGARAEDLERLLRWGGFPEPLFRANSADWRRWQRQRHERVIRQDLVDLERVKEVSLLEMLLEALPERVGSPLSVKSLRELLEVSHETAERWVQILERLYLVYRIPPFGAKRIRAVKKEQKLYFWDWSSVPDPGARFENLVASQLLKYCHLQEDTQGFKMELRFVRDTDGREIDFVVLQDGRPLFAVECKTGERELSRHIAYFKERTAIPAFYQVHLGKRDFGVAETGGRVLPFTVFCRELALP